MELGQARRTGDVGRVVAPDARVQDRRRVGRGLDGDLNAGLLGERRVDELEVSQFYPAPHAQHVNGGGGAAAAGGATTAGCQQGRGGTDAQASRSGALQKLAPVNVVGGDILFDELIQVLTVTTIENRHDTLLWLTSSYNDCARSFDELARRTMPIYHKRALCLRRRQRQRCQGWVTLAVALACNGRRAHFIKIYKETRSCSMTFRGLQWV